MKAPSYYEHNAKAPELDCVLWDADITVTERVLTPEEAERLRRQMAEGELRLKVDP